MRFIKNRQFLRIILFLFLWGVTSCSEESGLSFHYLNPTKYVRLDEINLPADMKKIDSLSCNITPGEFEPLSFIIKSFGKTEILSIKITELKNENNKLFNGIIDPYIVKVWYQAGITSKDIRNENSKLLTQELLIKNDKLIKLDRINEQNYLLCKTIENKEKYINITDSPNTDFSELKIADTPDLQPFILDDDYRQIWLKCFADSSELPGIYRGFIEIATSGKNVHKIPIRINVLPFKLDDPRIIYSVYYTGQIKDYQRPYHYVDKTEKQLTIELKDIKDHGFNYPVNYQKNNYLLRNLEIRKSLGYSTDKILQIDLNLFSDAVFNNDTNSLISKVREYSEVIKKSGWDSLYIYGIDEADSANIKKQIPFWQKTKSLCNGIFIGAVKDVYKYVDNEISFAVVHGETDFTIPEKFHKQNIKVLSYHNPQAGQENPEIYRNNYGFDLILKNYDGAMIYAYQKNYGNFWNDFDDPEKRFREEAFTYPVTDGIISTIQWEGMREAIDDIRYFETLYNLQKHSENNKISRYELLNKFKMNDNDATRKKLIKEILKIVQSE